MRQTVVDAAYAVAAVNAVAAIVGGICWQRGLSGRAFWILLRAGQAAAVVFAALVGVAAGAGRHSSEGLFYLYALLPLAVGLVAEQLRIASAQTVLDLRQLEDAQAVGRLPPEEQRRVVAAILSREMGVMALSALVVAFLALRAASTAHGF